MEYDLTVGRLAAALTRSGVAVSIRTLHHWDAVGLLKPSLRSAAGYRLYSGSDLRRAQRVLVYRELGVPLEAIAALLAGQASVHEQLAETDRALREKIAQLQKMQNGVERMMAQHASGANLSPEQQKEIFGDDFKPEWLTEAKERWGDTDAWAQNAERAASRTDQDWRDLTSAGKAMEARLARGFAAAVEPGSPEANELAEAHRAWLNTHFDVDYARQVCLARMYLADPRFTAHYDAVAIGMTQWLVDIISANAREHGVDPATVS